MNTSTIINIVIIALIAWFVYKMFRPIKGLRTLNANDFEKEIGKGSDALLIDVREPYEFQNGSISGAKNIPMSQLGKRLGEIPKDRSVLLYCQSGMRSKNAARILSKNGYERLAHLQGGISAWRGRVKK